MPSKKACLLIKPSRLCRKRSKCSNREDTIVASHGAGRSSELARNLQEFPNQYSLTRFVEADAVLRKLYTYFAQSRAHADILLREMTRLDYNRFCVFRWWYRLPSDNWQISYNKTCYLITKTDVLCNNQ